MNGHRYRVTVLIGVALSSLLCGCAFVEPPGPEPPAGPSEPAPTQTALSAEDAALEAYRGMWSVIIHASHTTDPDYSELDRYAQGDALELARHGLGAEADEGVVARGEPVLDPRVVSIEPETAEVRDCIDSSEWLREDAETGELVEEQPEDPILRRIDATTSHDGFAWRVSELRIWESGSC